MQPEKREIVRHELQTEDRPSGSPQNNYSDELYVHDSSLDYKGDLPLRASTGSWKAAGFFISTEFIERLGYFSISSNLITYLTTVMHQDLETAVNSVNTWAGVSLVMPIFGGFLGDSYVGRFYIALFSSLLYVLVLCLFIMTQYIPSLKPCNNSYGTILTTCQNASKIHKATFFTAAYLLSIATGGLRPCLEAFGADQFDDNHLEERKQKMSYFNWWIFALHAGGILGLTVIVYIEDNVGWGVAFIILASAMGFIVVIFISGRTLYRYKTVKGSPLTPMFMVLVAALAKRNLPNPSDSSLLNEVLVSQKVRRLHHTNRLRFLDKAAIVEEQERGPWRLATVTQVEELKLIINMIPIWLSCLVFGIGIAQTHTFFIKQGSVMHRRLSRKFEIPPASVNALVFMSTAVVIPIYDKLLIPYLRRVRGNERGLSILNRIAIGMVLLIVSMVVSALVERKRLLALQNGTMFSVFWLVPQTLIFGIGDAFSIVGLQELFYEQAPDSMKSLGMAFCLSINGVGSFLSSLLIIIVNAVTGKNGGKKWIGKDVNHSRLDYFYWLLTVIFVMNMGVFIFLVKGNNRYKNVQRFVTVSESDEGNKGEEHAYI
ncbi:protein NRT1/ PTR FAMILY 5.6-like [Silene latifolia]|uniref:protein NRT1/ PTR FAMILY 5.6-like n=1 Tax=Silene latifolia TaxID=37657 RepID=UPI003D779DD9